MAISDKDIEALREIFGKEPLERAAVALFSGQDDQPSPFPNNASIARDVIEAFVHKARGNHNEYTESFNLMQQHAQEQDIAIDHNAAQKQILNVIKELRQ